jgi:hypothetical protein
MPYPAAVPGLAGAVFEHAAQGSARGDAALTGARAYAHIRTSRPDPTQLPPKTERAKAAPSKANYPAGEK